MILPAVFWIALKVHKVAGQEGWGECEELKVSPARLLTFTLILIKDCGLPNRDFGTLATARKPSPQAS